MDTLPRLAIKLIAIGASTGGVEALRDVITPLPKSLPPIIITQHMPPIFTRSFAERLNKISVLTVKEAENGEILKSGTVYIAPGGLHMEVRKPANGIGFLIRTFDGEAVSSHKPSVDVMFDSAAQADGSHTLGVMLTGMGRDGAKGMLTLKQAGAFNIGQDEATSLVYGMPKAAFLGGGVDVQLPLQIISEAITHITAK